MQLLHCLLGVFSWRSMGVCKAVRVLAMWECCMMVTQQRAALASFMPSDAMGIMQVTDAIKCSHAGGRPTATVAGSVQAMLHIPYRICWQMYCLMTISMQHDTHADAAYNDRVQTSELRYTVTVNSPGMMPCVPCAQAAGMTLISINYFVNDSQLLRRS